VSAKYEMDGQVVGTLGVIGPTRMHYEKMIQIVDLTSKLLTNALSHKWRGGGTDSLELKLQAWILQVKIPNSGL